MVVWFRRLKISMSLESRIRNLLTAGFFSSILIIGLPHIAGTILAIIIKIGDGVIIFLANFKVKLLGRIILSRLNGGPEEFMLKPLLITLCVCLCIFGEIRAQAPVVSSFTPASGPVGSTVTINGSNFNATAASDVVFFGGVKATVISASTTSLKVTVPYGSTFQPISVLNVANGLQCYSAASFLATFNESSRKSFTAKSFGINPMTGSSGGIIVFLQLIDIDGDGKLDLVMLNTFNQTIDIYRNTSTTGSLTSSSFTLATVINVIDPAIAYTPYGIQFADLDGDGKPDLVVPYADANAIAIFKNTSVPGTINSQTFAAEVDFTTNSTPYGVAVADLDGDGKPEIITANYGASGVSVFRNVTAKGVINSSSFSARKDFSTDVHAASIQAGDLDGDGKIDLVVGNDGGFTVLKNTTASAGNFAFTKSDVTTSGGSFRAFIGDLDADGKTDIVIVSPLSKNATVYKNTTAGAGSAISFASPLVLATTSQVASMTIADINGDAKPDLVLAPYNGDYSIIPNTNITPGILSFGPEVLFPVNLNDLSAVVVGDVDGDGKNDVVGADTYGNLTLFHNNIVGLPTITSFSPASAGAGQTVTLTGTNFTGATAVTFGGTNAASFKVVSSTSIAAVLGSTGANGVIAVTTADGTGSSTTAFTYNLPPAPTITAFTPASAKPGTTVTITGTNFINASAVTFGGTAAKSFTVISATSITAVVGAGATGSVSVVTPSGTGTFTGFTFIPVPIIVPSTTQLPALSTTQLVPSSSTSFTVSGTNMSAGILVIPPSGFEVSTDNSTFSSTLTIGAAGTISSATIYVRLSASATQGYYSGNFVLSSTGAASVNVAISTSTVLPPLKYIVATAVTGAIGACPGVASAGPNIDQFTITGTNLTANVTATAPAGFEISLSSGTGYTNSLTFTQSGGNVSATTIYVRSAAAASPGNISGNIVFNSAGVPGTNVAVKGVIEALVGVNNTIPNQTLSAGDTTKTINFNTTGYVNWVNDTPSIGLPASGSGSIPPFVAANLGTSPLTATITANPQLAGTVYLTDYDVNAYYLLAFSTSNYSLLARINVGGADGGIVLSPDDSKIYVACEYNDRVYVINTASNSIADTIGVNSGPRKVAISPDGNRLYVTDYADRILSVINTTTNKVIAAVPTSAAPTAVIVSRDGKKVYVANQGNVQVLDATTNTFTASFSAGTYPLALATSLDGTKLYVVNNSSNNVSVINTADNSTITTIKVGRGPSEIALSPDGSKLYIPCTSSSLSVINTVDNTVINNAVPGMGGGALGVSVTPDGRTIFVSSGNATGFYAIDASTYKILYTSPSGVFHGGNFAVGNFVTPPMGCLGAPTTFTVTVKPVLPSIQVSGSLLELSTTPGTSSSTTNFIVSAANLRTGITITAPSGFELSSDNVSFNNSIIVGATGTLAQTTIYVRLAASASAGNYSGNIVLSSTLTSNVTIATSRGVVSVSPFINVNTVTGEIATCQGSASASPNVQQVPVSGSGLTGNITLNAPAGFEISLSPGSGYGPGVSINPSSGVVPNTTIYIRSASTAATGNLSGNLTASSPGATGQSAQVQGTVSALPAINPVISETVANGTTVAPIVFTGTANGYLWTNSLPSIGLAANGSGNTPSFKAVNKGGSTVTATITATPAPNNGFAYIANSSSNTVSVVNVSSNTVLTTIPVGQSPAGVYLSPDHSKVYVANYNSNSISVINVTSNSVTSTISLSGQPSNLVVSPDGNTLYVTTNYNSGSVSVVNVSSNTEKQMITVGTNPQGIAISPDGRQVFVANFGSNNVSVINTLTGTVAATVTVGLKPLGVAVSPDGHKVFVANSGDTYVSVISTKADTVLASIGAGQYPTGVAISANGKTLYVPSLTDGLLAVLDVSTSPAQDITNVSVGSQPYGISLSADGGLAYIVNSAGKSASVLNTTTNKLIATIPLSATGTGLGNFIAPGTGCTGSPTIFTITVQPSPAVITATGSLFALNTVSGTASSTASFSVSGVSLSAGILVTAPAGFEVSTNNTTFSNTVTVGTGGAIVSTVVYVRLAAADLPGNYSGNVVLSCTGATSVNVAVPKSLVTLSQANFKLAITSATCRGENDGSLSITAAQTMNYTATITGNSLNTPYPFTSSVNIGSLAAGTYNVCVTIAGQSDFSQCFSVVITEPQDLSVYSTVNSDNTLTLALNGGNRYNIQLNGISYNTTDNSITLPLAVGNNELIVTTDRLCQGTWQKVVNASGKITPYPVPFQNTLNLNLGDINISSVSIAINDVSNGRLVYSKQFVNQSGVLQLDVTNLNNGVYVLHLLMNKAEKVFKIIKK